MIVIFKFVNYEFQDKGISQQPQNHYSILDFSYIIHTLPIVPSFHYGITNQRSIFLNTQKIIGIYKFENVIMEH